MVLLYGRAGRLNTKNAGFRPGQLLGQLKTVDWSTSFADNPDDEPVTDETSDGLNGVRFHRLITLQNGHVVTISYRKLNTFRHRTSLVHRSLHKNVTGPRFPILSDPPGAGRGPARGGGGGRRCAGARGAAGGPAHAVLRGGEALAAAKAGFCWLLILLCPLILYGGL